jgi:TetR/AcrR family transcriptional repressor of mexJK operon
VKGADVARSNADPEVPNAPRKGGRPSLQEAEQKRGLIIDVATALFLTQGYGATSIEAIARGAGISKRTFYDRFGDKAELFGAVIHEIVGRVRPNDLTPLFADGTFEQILLRLAGLALGAVLRPEALALQRVILAEAARFPELAVVVSGEGSRGEAIVHISALIEREHAAGRVRIKDAKFAAEQFLQMVISLPQRRAMGLGTPMTPAELATWATNTVALFLHGCCG